MSSPYILNKIRLFCNERPNLIAVGAGDAKQLPSIEPFADSPNGKEYVDICIGMIFQ